MTLDEIHDQLIEQLIAGDLTLTEQEIDLIHTCLGMAYTEGYFKGRKDGFIDTMEELDLYS